MYYKYVQKLRNSDSETNRRDAQMTSAAQSRRTKKKEIAQPRIVWKEIAQREIVPLRIVRKEIAQREIVLLRIVRKGIAQRERVELKIVRSKIA